MFLDKNRKMNGAADPGLTASQDASAQRAAEELVPVLNDLGSPQTRRFVPDLETIAAISKRHKEGGLNEGNMGPNYEGHIPVGPRMP